VDSNTLNEALEILGSYLFDDLKRLQPTQEELDKAGIWCKTHDVSQEFSIHLAEALRQLGE